MPLVPPAGPCETIIMRCKQTACPVPPATHFDLSPSGDARREKGKIKSGRIERECEVKQGRDEEAEGEGGDERGTEVRAQRGEPNRSEREKVRVRTALETKEGWKGLRGSGREDEWRD